MDSTPKPGPGIAEGPTIPSSASPTTTLEERVTALETWRASQAPTVPAAAGPRAGWYRPNDTETSRFAQRYTIPSVTAGQFVISAMTNPDDIADALARAAFGYQPGELRAVWDAFDLERSRSFCDRIAAAPTAAAANEILLGAGDPGVEMDCALYLIMTGSATFPGLGDSGHVGLGGATTVAQAVEAYLAQTTPGQGGPGPSGSQR